MRKVFCVTFAEVVQELVRDYLEAIKLERKSLEMELKVLCGGMSNERALCG